MQGWQTPYLGLRDLPRELTEFELQAFFSFSRVELELIARRRGDNHKLGLALHIGFVRMSGRPLNSVRAVPAVLLRHLGQMLDIATPDLASLRALYARGRTLFDHQQQACEALGFAWMTEHQRRALVRVLRDEVAHSADRERLLLHARHWLYEHRLLIVHDRVIRGLVAAALTELEAVTAQAIRAAVPAVMLKRWASALDSARPDGQHCQSWLWSTPAKHSTRQIAEVLERIAFLTELGIANTWAVSTTCWCAATRGAWPPDRPRSAPGSRSRRAQSRWPVSCATACSRPRTNSSSCSSAAWPTCGGAARTA